MGTIHCYNSEPISDSTYLPILEAAVKFSKERNNKRISENAYNYALGFFDSKLNDEENEKIENDKFLEFMRSQPLRF